MMLSKMTCVWPVGQGSRGVTTMSADVARQRLGARTSGTACGAHAALQRHVALAGHTARITDSRLVNISVGKQSTDMADASVSEWQGGGLGILQDTKAGALVQALVSRRHRSCARRP